MSEEIDETKLDDTVEKLDVVLQNLREKQGEIQLIQSNLNYCKMNTKKERDENQKIFIKKIPNKNPSTGKPFLDNERKDLYNVNMPLAEAVLQDE